MANPLGRGVMLGRFSHSVLPIVLFVLFLYVQNNAVTKTILASRVEPVVFLDPRLWRNEIRTAFIFVQQQRQVGTSTENHSGVTAGRIPAS